MAALTTPFAPAGESPDAEASAPPPGPGAPGDTPATRAPVTSGSQTMSLNAHAWTGYD